jgi:hypothetical protein
LPSLAIGQFLREQRFHGQGNVDLVHSGRVNVSHGPTVQGR